MISLYSQSQIVRYIETKQGVVSLLLVMDHKLGWGMHVFTK